MAWLSSWLSSWLCAGPLTPLCAPPPHPPQGEDGDPPAVGPVAGMERRELNYAALEFIRGRPREEPSGRGGDDGANYSEIKAK